MFRRLKIKRLPLCGHFVRVLIVIAAAIALPSCESQPSPIPRPGPAFDGSAKWALNIAQPSIKGFAADAKVYNVLGALVYKDGRLPSNLGDWSFITWSLDQKKVFQVTVKYDGTATTSTRDQASPPSLNEQSIPDGWVNSPDIFAAAAPYLSSGVTQATLVVFNRMEFSQAPDQPVWEIDFNEGPDQLVSWDGTYLGTQ